MARLSTVARRAQLLELGRGVFAEQPYDTVSVAGLAKAAGVSKGLLYHYFPDKHAFYVAVLTQVAEDVIEVIDPPATGTPHEAIRHVLEGFVTYVEANQPFYKALIRGGIGSDSGTDAVVERVRRTAVARVEARIGLAPGALDPLLYGWIGFVEFVVLDWLERRDRTAEALVDLLLAALFKLLEV